MDPIHMPEGVPPELAGAVAVGVMAFFGVILVICLIAYLFGSFCVAHMAKKMGKPFGTSFLMAIIPIATSSCFCKWPISRYGG